MTERKNPALAAVEGLVSGGLAHSDDRILGEIMEGGIGLALAYQPDGRDLSIATHCGTYEDGTKAPEDYKEIYLDGSGLNLLVAALVDMGLVERKKELT